MPGVGVTWSSSDPSVATVGADGTVRAVSNGGTTITAQATVARDGGVDPSVTARGTASVTVDFPVLSELRLSPVSGINPSGPGIFDPVVTLRAYGAREEIVANALDQHGRPMSGIEFDWWIRGQSEGAEFMRVVPLGGARSGRARIDAYRNGEAWVGVNATYVGEGVRVAAGETTEGSIRVGVSYPIRMELWPPTVNQGVQDLGAGIPLISGRRSLLRFKVWGYPTAVENEADLSTWDHPLPPIRFEVRDESGTVRDDGVIENSGRFVSWLPDMVDAGLEESANVFWRHGPMVPPMVEIHGAIVPPAHWPVGARSHLTNSRSMEVLPGKYSPIALMPVLQSRRPDLDRSIEWVRDFGWQELYPTETFLAMGTFPITTGIDRLNTYTTSVDVTTDSGMGQLLREMLVAWKTRWGRVGPMTYGVLELPPGASTVGKAFLNGVVAIGWTGHRGPNIYSVGAGARTMAHELGHLMGHRHAPCGGPDELDPSYPYSDGKIGGRVFGWGWDAVDEHYALRSSEAYFDIMSYCGPQWISDYHYLRALRFYHGPHVRLGRELNDPPPSHSYETVLEIGHGQFADRPFDHAPVGGTWPRAPSLGGHGSRRPPA